MAARYGDAILNRRGEGIANVSVQVLTYPGGVVATIYSDNGITLKSNPVFTDDSGAYEFWANAGDYSLLITGTNVQTKQIDGLSIGSGTLSAASAAAAAASAAAASASTTAAAASTTAAAASAVAAAASAASIALPLPLASGGLGVSNASIAAARTTLLTPSRSEIQSQTYTAFTTGGSSTVYTLTPSPVSAANAAGQRFRASFHTAAGATPTLAVSGLAPLNLKYKDSTGTKQAVTATQIPTGWIADVENDGTDWVVLGTPPVTAVDNAVNDFRLTLTSGAPVTTADVIGATSVYITPYLGNRIALYDGVSAWVIYTSAELTQALGAITNGLPYDMFAYNNAGVVATEILAWTNGTARATALVYQDGVLVKSGATTRRYLGTFYTTSATTTEDSAANRLLFNYDNAVARIIKNSFTVDRTVASVTYAEINTEIRCKFIYGVAQKPVILGCVGSVGGNSTNSSNQFGLGIDSATVATAGMETYNIQTVAPLNMSFSNTVIPAVGFHYVAALGASTAGTLTYLAASGASGAKFFLAGVIQG